MSVDGEFLNQARMVLAYEDSIPPSEVILNRLYLSRHITADEFSLLRKATRKPRGLVEHLRAWWVSREG